LFCALWMAVAAGLIVPLWLFEPLLAPAILAAGAIPGVLLQPFAVGCESNARRAAVAGMLCAALEVPLGGFLVFMIDDPQHFVRDPVRALRSLFSLSGLVLGFLFWWLLPLGACAGAILQIVWVRRAQARDGSGPAGDGDAGPPG
jgi:hypothetical protein